MEQGERRKGKKPRRAGGAAGAPEGAEAEQAAAVEKPPKKRRRVDAEAAGEAQEEAAAATRPAKSRRGGGGAAATEQAEAPQAATDEQRREVQRQIQQLVVRLRKEGKSEKDIKAAKEELKRSAPAPLAKPDGSRARKKQAWIERMESKEPKEPKEPKDDTKAWRQSLRESKKSKEDARKQKLQTVHDVVVIPVLWRGRHDKLDVLKAAEDIKVLLAQQGLDVWVDSRRQYTPGQKFAHWEHRGVLIRVEVGPDDLQNGVCRVCLAKTPGDYKAVERKRVRLPPAGARSLLLALKEFGLSSIDIERRKGDSDEEENMLPAPGARANAASGSAAAGAAASAAAGAPEAEDDVKGNWAPRQRLEDKLRDKKAKKRAENKRVGIW